MSNEKCRYPFQSISIYPSGHIRPCCAFKEDIGHVDSISNIVDFFHNDTHLNKLRDNEIAGIPTLPGCDLCYNNASTNSSRKIIFNNSIKHIGVTKENTLTNFDLSFGNTCNLTCVMCSSQYSSKIATIESKFNQPWKPIHSNFSLSRKQIDELLTQLTNVSLVELKGGEPLLSKDCVYFLERITDINPTAEIEITTNFTIVSKEFLKVIRKNSKIKLIISMDGVGETYEWIRGIKDDALINNLKLIAEYAPASIKRINFCVSAFNLHHIPQYDIWFNTFRNQYRLDSSFVVYDLIAKEEHVSPRLTANSNIKMQLIELSNLQHHQITKNSLKRLLEYITQNNNKDINRSKFIEWHEFMVKERGFDIL
jgi:MoaA/NifB/PqqE/SkfB family radical SAM enzyme